MCFCSFHFPPTLGAAVTDIDGEDRTPLHAAYQNGYVKIARVRLGLSNTVTFLTVVVLSFSSERERK